MATHEEEKNLLLAKYKDPSMWTAVVGMCDISLGVLISHVVTWTRVEPITRTNSINGFRSTSIHNVRSSLSIS